jgi:hypothetical protein
LLEGAHGEKRGIEEEEEEMLLNPYVDKGASFVGALQHHKGTRMAGALLST